MKFAKLACAFLCALMISCTSNEEDIDLEKKVAAYLQFENVFDGNAFKLNHNYTSSNNGILNITTFKYMITDITLHGVEGTQDHTITTKESFHIIDQACEASYYKYLTNVPNGTYNSITLRYGVSEEVFELGTEAQGEMLVAAKAAGLNWGWTAGYRFMTYEGSYQDGQGSFKVHNGSHGSTGQGHGDSHAKEAHDTPQRIDNSKLITLDFPNNAKILVSTDSSPKVHLKIDIARVLDNKDNDENDLDVSQGDIIIDAHKSPKVAENVSKMFAVHHIHNDPGFELPELKDCGDTSNPNEGGDHDHGDSHAHGS